MSGGRMRTLPEQDRVLVSSQVRRAVSACAIVTVLCLGVWIVQLVFDTVRTSIHATKTVEEVWALGSMESMDNMAEAYDTAPPRWFEEEMFSLDSFSDVRVAEQGAVVGFSFDGSAEVAWENLSALLVQKGWICIDSGMAGSGVFVKSDGVCQWVWVSCTDIAGLTSVVVQCAQHG